MENKNNLLKLNTKKIKRKLIDFIFKIEESGKQ